MTGKRTQKNTRICSALLSLLLAFAITLTGTLSISGLDIQAAEVLPQMTDSPHETKMITSEKAVSSADTGTPKVLKTVTNIKAAQQETAKYVEISFNSVNGAISYDIYRSTKSKKGYKKIGSATSTSFVDKNVTAAKTYYYKVRANASMAKYNSKLSSKYAKVKILTKPKIKAKSSKTGQINVSWKKIEGAKGYVIYTSSKKDIDYKAVKTIKNTKKTKNAKTVEAAITPKNGTKTLYVRVRPYYTKNSKKIYGPNSKAVCVKAQKSYKITYVLDKGTNSSKNPSTYKYNKLTRLYPPAKTGYLFKGWYTDKTFTNKIDSIKKGTTGNIKLYALWELDTLNINSVGTEDMIWNWWYYPQVVSYEGTQKNLYWGFATSEGYCGVAAYNYSTNTTYKTILKRSFSVDDHNSLALTIMQDGRIMCVYAGGHNADNEIHVRISNNPESIERFDTSVVLRSSGKTCYSQILQYNGKYYIFYRVNNKSWAYRVSSNGINWTDEVILVSSSIQYYCKFMPTTQDGIIRICMYSNPTDQDPAIRMGFFNLNTGKLYNSDNQTELGTQDIPYTSFNIIINSIPGFAQRMFDVAITEPEHPLILYATFSKNKTVKNSTYKLYDAGNITDICQGGSPIWNPKYQSGASFIGNEKIVLSREEANYDIIELYNYTDKNLEFQESVYNEEIRYNVRNARPIVDMNGKAFLWHRGYYDPTCYTNFYTEAKLFFIVNTEQPEEPQSSH